MKVILLAPTPPPIGGIAIWTERMMNAKLKHNWCIEVVDEKIIGARQVFGDKTKYNYLLEIKRCFKIWSDLKHACKDTEVRIVHSCIPANTKSILREYICACIAKRFKRKFIVHFRCTVPNAVHGWINKKLVKLICDKSDCVIVLNTKSLEYVKQLSNTFIQLIPNFVEFSEIEETHEINEKIKTVLYAGGVIDSKGCLDLIEVAKVFPDIEFKMIGNPSKSIKIAAEKVHNVNLVGEKKHDVIHEEMKKADIFAFLSYYNGEGFSNSLVEAMACGLPCIVTDWAANKDMIEDKGGEVVSIKSPQKAIDALRKMMPMNIRKIQSEFNIKKVKLMYNSEIVLEQYVDCYESIL